MGIGEMGIIEHAKRRQYKPSIVRVRTDGYQEVIDKIFPGAYKIDHFADSSCCAWVWFKNNLNGHEELRFVIINKSTWTIKAIIEAQMGDESISGTDYTMLKKELKDIKQVSSSDIAGAETKKAGLTFEQIFVAKMLGYKGLTAYGDDSIGAYVVLGNRNMARYGGATKINIGLVLNPEMEVIARYPLGENLRLFSHSELKKLEKKQKQYIAEADDIWALAKKEAPENDEIRSPEAAADKRIKIPAGIIIERTAKEPAAVNAAATPKLIVAPNSIRPDITETRPAEKIDEPKKQQGYATANMLEKNTEKQTVSPVSERKDKKQEKPVALSAYEQRKKALQDIIGERDEAKPEQNKPMTLEERKEMYRQLRGEGKDAGQQAEKRTAAAATESSRELTPQYLKNLKAMIVNSGDPEKIWDTLSDEMRVKLRPVFSGIRYNAMLKGTDLGKLAQTKFYGNRR